MTFNEKGFTLIEVLITLMILLALTAVLPSLMISSVRTSGLDPQQEEEQLFYVLVAREVRGASYVVTNGKNLTLTKPSGDTITFEMYGNVIRRRVNGTGHEVVLQGVKGMTIEISGPRIKVGLVLTNGSTKEEVCYQLGNSL
ncbi:competence type IV pilus minor pilin ComGF [Guptibacillus algicola]|uniref:competence type IV pilus minor pilin ComGF n=1 Tax=Guptibacillus algicola TaxID=225844 RepID=UPI001CD67656|nr:competence type IV pilus minor pilin ComGF [Alkalihalobacillus algicola]MCA0986005.1 prepilin-type N-terminal cleavage/methylation domain-containing protein [Alkalihalobacillus algicola]